MHTRHSQLILVGGIGLIIILMAVGGIFGIYATRHMEEINADFYQRPYSTNIYVRNVESSFRAIKNCIQDLMIVDDLPEFDSLEFRLKYYCESMQVQLEHLHVSCQHEQPYTDELTECFKQWLPIRDEIVKSVKTNIENEPFEITRGEGAQHVKKITTALDELIESANQRAKKFVDESRKQATDERKSTELLDRFYQHPYAVGNAVRQIQAGTIAIHRDMKDVATAPDQTKFHELVENIDRQEKTILESFKLVNRQFLGDHAQVAKAETLFRQWQAIRQKVIDRRQKQLDADYEQISEKKSDPKLDEMERMIEELKKHANNEALEAYKRSQHVANETVAILAVTIGAAVILSVITAITIIYLNHSYVKTLHKTQDLLREREENLRITLHSIGDGVIVTDAAGMVVMINRITEKLSGWRLEEIKGRPLDDFFRIINSHTRQPVQSPINDVIKNEKSVELANGSVLVSRDSTEYHIEDSAAPIMAPSGKLLGVVMVFRDVTQQKKMQMEIQNTQKMEALGQLAGGVAHEFNNLLQVILGFSEILREDPANLNESRICLENITNAANHGASLVAQLLDFTRKSRFKTAPVKLDAIVYGILKVLRKSYGENISLNFHSNDSVVVNADPNQIRQVLINLCNNARDAIGRRPGEILISIDCEKLDADRARSLKLFPGEYGAIKVSDTGKGMDRKILEKIFEPFFTTKEVGEGTGLGLSAVKGIIENHAGAILVESTPDIGTTVLVYLPLVTGEPTQKMDMDRKKITIQGSSRKAVFADDDEMLLDLGRRMLEKAGFDVIVANDGQDAIDICRKYQGKIDLLLFDVRMPVISGAQAYETIRSEFGDIPIIYATGYDDKNANIDALPGARAVLQKPYEEAKLIEELYAIFHGSQTPPADKN